MSGSGKWSYQCGVVLWAILVGCKGSQAEPQQTSSDTGASGTGASGTGAPGSDVASSGVTSSGVTSGGVTSNGISQLTAEPERFRFVLPTTYVPRELRGEGSETMLAPSDAQFRASASGISVEAGSDFALDIQFQPTLSALPSALDGAQRAASEKDVVVFKAGDGYSFLVLRELVPEWDESERRRVACASAGVTGSAPAGVQQRRFSRTAVERMVAACRSLDLPRLE